MLLELARREKSVGIKPDVDLDIFMKSIAFGGENRSCGRDLVVEYIIKSSKFLSAKIFFTRILGLDIYGDTLVGDEILNGISEGQKKRLIIGLL
ncbi:hypothetical protein AHAS_Ahas03G0246600 [Arachis hypogaea]